MGAFNTIPPNPYPPSSDQQGNGSGSQYELPIASAETLGGVKVGTGLSINAETGELSNSNPTPYSLPIASDEALGGVKVGAGLSINAETGELENTNPTPYTPVSYSTTEVNTGKKWIDGKDIFAIVLETTITTSGNVAGDIKSGTLSLASLIASHENVWFDVDMSYYLDTSDQRKGFVGGYYDEGGDELFLMTMYARTSATAKLVLYYTKTTT